MADGPGKKSKYEKGVRLRLFLTFLKIGLFTFGGGYAMLPLIHNDVVENKNWITDDEMVDMLAISESTPGPFAINAATFVGYRMGGIAGSAAATAGIVLPSLLIIIILSFLFDAFRSNPWIDAAFSGIRAGVVVLIINAVLKLASKMTWKIFYIFLAAATFALSVFFDFNVIYMLLASGVIGLVYSLMTSSRMDGGAKK